MRYALIIAGGSGTRLWPMSRNRLPKQLIPVKAGRSLLQLAVDRLQGVVPAEHLLICAGQSHRDLILRSISGIEDGRFYGEPVGRDTLNAIGLVTAHLAQRDPAAVVGVFTADHVIEPMDEFRRIVAAGYDLAEAQADTLVTFGINPTHPATGFGYLELGSALPLAASGQPACFLVSRFKEKPDLDTAHAYLAAGGGRYLWNSGMFVWRAGTFLAALRRFAPANHDPLMELARVWDTPQRPVLLERMYPQLPKVSVDYAIMEPASRADDLRIAAVSMPLDWLDVGSWPAFARICERDADSNACAPADLKHASLDSRGNLLASSDAGHLIATIGCENLIIVHTPDATLVCRADRAEDLKKLHALLAKRFGSDLL